jgi:ubiquinone/menaquinone biosynthesis C-methylase UbiE
MSTVQADFDRIAVLSSQKWDHNNHYHDFLLKQLPAHCGEALDIGCGMGEFARLLARRCDHVTAVDLSPQMIQRAREESGGFSNIDYQVGDVMQMDLPAEHFGCIASIATLHHLPLEPMLVKMKAALKPGGVLLVLDLFKYEGALELLQSAMALPVDMVLKRIKGHVEESPELQQAWMDHGKTDQYLTTAQVRAACDKVLPGAKITKHLLWRYSLVWKKA